MSIMHGASVIASIKPRASPQVSLTGFSMECENSSSNSVFVRFDRDGEVYRTNECSTVYSQDYLVSGKHATVGDAFEVRLTVVSGNDPNSGDAIDTWHTIDNTIIFTKAENPSLDQNGVWTLEVREIANVFNIDSMTVNWALVVGD